MLAAYTGIFMMFGLAAVAVCVAAVVLRRPSAHPATPRTDSSDACPREPEPGRIDPRQRVSLPRVRAGFAFLVLTGGLLCLIPWMLAFRALGSEGFSAVLAFAAPLAVMFGVAWARGSFE